MIGINSGQIRFFCDKLLFLNNISDNLKLSNYLWGDFRTQILTILIHILLNI